MLGWTQAFKMRCLIRIFDLDCQAAGIPKTDERGRVIDIHALRTTFGTHLSASGAHLIVSSLSLIWAIRASKSEKDGGGSKNIGSMAA